MRVRAIFTIVGLLVIIGAMSSAPLKAQGEDPKITTSDGGNTIRVIGVGKNGEVMSPNTVNRLKPLMRAGVRVEFTAPYGGSVVGSRKIAELLNEYKATLAVPANATCASGCAAAYAATREHIADTTSLFQVHCPGAGCPPGDNPLLGLYSESIKGQRLIKFFEGCGKGHNPLVDIPELVLPAVKFNKILDDPEYTCSQL